MTAKAKTPTACECGQYSFKVNSEQKTTGCKGDLTYRKFAPGHDAKLKSLLIQAAVEDAPVNDSPALEIAREYGFADQVEVGAARRIERAKARNARHAGQHDTDGEGGDVPQVIDLRDHEHAHA